MASKEELLSALANMTDAQLQGILSQGNGRSPMRPRQLHDLRLAPTATDPRPLFIPSAEGSRDVPETHSPYPRLMWNIHTGQEITVYSLDEFNEKIDSEQYGGFPPEQAPMDPVARAKEMFDALSPEDQALVLEQQRAARISAVTAAMGWLTQSQAAEAIGVPAKRPGRKSA